MALQCPSGAGRISQLEDFVMQGWVIYFPFVLGPAFLTIGGLFIIWESSGKLHRGERMIFIHAGH